MHTDHYEIHSAYTRQQVCVLADHTREDADTLICVSLDPSEINSLPPKFVDKFSTIEVRCRLLFAVSCHFVFSASNKTHTLCFAQIKGKVWSVSEDRRAYRQSPRMFGGTLRVLRNELAVQHIIPPRRFLCLTSHGLHVIAKNRPVDVLLKIVLDSSGRDSQDITVRTSFCSS